MRDELAARLPDLYARVEEKPMFGGLCFMLDGHMLGAASDRGAMLRVGREGEPEALALPGVTRMEMGGRPKPGYVRVEAATFADVATRGRLIEMAVGCVATLPPKEAK